jgi:hypothetical protein
MYFLQGSLHWSKGGGFAPDPDDISRKLFRKLFRKFCKEYVLRESQDVFSTGLSDVSNCWFSRKLFQKCCKEYVLRDN